MKVKFKVTQWISPLFHILFFFSLLCELKRLFVNNYFWWNLNKKLICQTKSWKYENCMHIFDNTLFSLIHLKLKINQLTANQLTGFYMRATLAFNGLRKQFSFSWASFGVIMTSFLKKIVVSVYQFSQIIFLKKLENFEI